MGYHMEQVSAEFRIPKEKKQAALAAIKALAGRTDKYGAIDHYSWVNTDSLFTNTITLEDAMQVWRWHTCTDVQGNVYDIEFTGEKAGDDDVLFEAIAPFVTANSFIEMLGEDGDRWRWEFDGTSIRERHAKIVWED